VKKGASLNAPRAHVGHLPDAQQMVLDDASDRVQPAANGLWHSRRPQRAKFCKNGKGAINKYGHMWR